MNVVRSHPEARWMPSRYTFALFRLGALMRLQSQRNAAPRPVFLAIDHGQSALENYTVGLWAFVTVACYLAACMQPWIGIVAAIACGIALSGWALQIPMYSVGVWFPGRDNRRLTSIATFAAMTGASLLAATRTSWVRWVAIVFFTALALNVLAAIVMFALCGVVQSAERRCAE